MTVQSRRQERVAIVTIDRPAASNAIDGPTAEALDVAVSAAEADRQVAVIVITGSGDRVFCAGIDLHYAAVHGPAATIRRAAGLAGIPGRRLAKPLIGAVNGDAFGGGFELVLACDLVVAVAGARFALPEVRRGLLASVGVMRLTRGLPRALALELALTGEPISAERARELGLVNRVVARERVLEEALELAGKVAAGGPLAVAEVRRLASELTGLPEEQAWRLARAASERVRGSNDAREGVRAFAEKRDPTWTGT